MRHIHKARELKASTSISAGSSLGGAAATASVSSTGSSGSVSAGKKGGGFFRGWGLRSKPEPPPPVPAPAPALALALAPEASSRSLPAPPSPGPAPHGSLPSPSPRLGPRSAWSSGGVAGGEPAQFAAGAPTAEQQRGADERAAPAPAPVPVPAVAVAVPAAPAATLRLEASPDPGGGGGGPHSSRVQRGGWRQGEKIGQGAFGLVFKGLNLANGEIVAIKELHFDPQHRKQLAEMVCAQTLHNKQNKTKTSFFSTARARSRNTKRY